LASALFSDVQARVLALIFGHPERSYYTLEIVRSVNSGTGAVQRELSKLQRSGLVSVERIGNQKHYKANDRSPVYPELRSLVLKTVGLTEPLRRALIPCAERIKAAFVYGSVAKGTDTARSDVDLMVIGEDVTYSDVFAGLQEAEKVLRRPVNPNFLTPSEWRRKLAEKNSFVAKIGTQPKLFVIGSEEDLMHG
jgi:predicted nucleotidyltransferase